MCIFSEYEIDANKTERARKGLAFLYEHAEDKENWDTMVHSAAVMIMKLVKAVDEEDEPVRSC